MTRIKFLIEAIKNFKEVGTVTRSGSAMRSKITSYITPEDTFVLELGSGDGAITKNILAQMGKDAKLLSFEINPNLFKDLQSIDDDRLIAINDSAENLELYMEKYGIKKFDTIISAIPYIIFPREQALKLLNLCKDNLKEGKSYLQVHYAKSLMSLYNEVFGNIETHFILFNIPPGYVFRCIR